MRTNHMVSSAITYVLMADNVTDIMTEILP
jgi:hypothetical protein